MPSTRSPSSRTSHLYTAGATHPVNSVPRRSWHQQLIQRVITRLNRVIYPAVVGYWHVRQPNSRGVVVLLLHHGKVLLVRHSYSARRWTLPGGSLKRGETPERAARREVREEVGITLQEVRNHGPRRSIAQGRRDTTWLLSAVLAADRVQLASWEIQAVRWVSVEQALTSGWAATHNLANYFYVAREQLVGSVDTGG